MIQNRTWLPTIWSAFIVLLSLAPSDEFSHTAMDGLDKFVHFVLYSLLSIFTVVAVVSESRFSVFQKHPLVYSFLYSFLFGTVLEIAQYTAVSDRSFELMDVVANAVGAGTGLLVFLYLYGNPKMYTEWHQENTPLKKE